MCCSHWNALTLHLTAWYLETTSLRTGCVLSEVLILNTCSHEKYSKQGSHLSSSHGGFIQGQEHALVHPVHRVACTDWRLETQESFFQIILKSVLVISCCIPHSDLHMLRNRKRRKNSTTHFTTEHSCMDHRVWVRAMSVKEKQPLPRDSALGESCPLSFLQTELMFPTYMLENIFRLKEQHAWVLCTA